MNADGSEVDLANEVRRFSAALGADPMLVQGAGGNISWKTSNTLWIKASGKWMADAESEDIFVPVDLLALQHDLQRGNFDSKPVVLGDSALRPSIETLLHGLMPHRVVVHVHAIDVLALLVRSDAPDLLLSKTLLDVQPALVPYRKPGAELAQAVASVIAAMPGSDVLYMRNHGLVVGGDSVGEVRERLNMVLAACRSDALASVGANEEGAVLAPDLASRWCAVDGVQDLSRDELLLERLRSNWALYPDHVVFLGPHPHVFESEEAVRQWMHDHPDEMLDVIFICGMGVYAARSLPAGKIAQLRCFRDVLVRVPPGAPLRTLDEQDVCALLNWDAERYRMQMVK